MSDTTTTTTDHTTDHTATVDAYFAMLNETDPDRRRALIVAPDGRLSRIAGFFGPLPEHEAA